MAGRLPLEVRKELLLSRAQLERVELAQAMSDFRGATAPWRSAGAILSGRGEAGAGLGGTVLTVLSLARRYPYLGSVASIAFGAVGRSRRVRRLVLLVALAAGGAWYATRVAQAPARPEPGHDDR